MSMYKPYLTCVGIASIFFLSRRYLKTSISAIFGPWDLWHIKFHKEYQSTLQSIVNIFPTYTKAILSVLSSLYIIEHDMGHYYIWEGCTGTHTHPRCAIGLANLLLLSHTKHWFPTGCDWLATGKNQQRLVVSSPVLVAGCPNWGEKTGPDPT